MTEAASGGDALPRRAASSPWPKSIPGLWPLENLRFSPELRSRHLIHEVQQAVCLDELLERLDVVLLRLIDGGQPLGHRLDALLLAIEQKAAKVRHAPERPLPATDARRDVGHVPLEIPLQFFQLACLHAAKPEEDTGLAQDPLDGVALARHEQRKLVDRLVTHPGVRGAAIGGRMEGGSRDPGFSRRALETATHDEFGEASAAMGRRRGHEGDVEDAIERHGEGGRDGMTIHDRVVPVERRPPQGITCDGIAHPLGRDAVGDGIQVCEGEPAPLVVDAAEANRRLHDVTTRYRKPAPALAAWLEENIPEALTILQVPAAHRRRLRTTNGLERLNKEIKRRTRVATLFPNEASLLRLASAVLSEISDDGETERAYLTMGAR